jgi:hypothetical protein
LVVASSERFTPPPAFGFPVVSSGGQAVAQAPLQVLLLPVSACHRYSVLPWESTRTDPRLVLATSTVPDDVLADDCDADAEPPLVLVVLEPLLPHAAMANALSGAIVSAASRLLRNMITP